MRNVAIDNHGQVARANRKAGLNMGKRASWGGAKGEIFQSRKSRKTFEPLRDFLGKMWWVVQGSNLRLTN